MSLLRDRDFLLLFVGQAVSRFGDGLYTAATAWLAWSLTKDPTAVAVVSVSAFAPAFLATFVSASYADRYDRRKLMIATDLARVAVVAVAAVLLSLGLLNLPLLVVTTALLALIGAPFAPARNAIVTQIVPADRLQQANGLLQVAFRAAFFVGPLMLAPLLAYGSMRAALVVNGLTFLGSAGAVAAIRVTRPVLAAGQAGLRADLAAGLKAVRAAPDVLVVIVTFVLALALTSGFLTVGLVAVVGQGGRYGLLLGVAGVAEVAGAAPAGRPADAQTRPGCGAGLGPARNLPCAARDRHLHSRGRGAPDRHRAGLGPHGHPADHAGAAAHTEPPSGEGVGPV
jgi:MFS family permease